MAKIKAFVGHSFTSDDEQVVTSFLQMFDQFKGALPSFEWTHARQAEPEELAKKVLRLVAESNTFIAICTKKELITQPDSVTSRIFSTSTSIVNNGDLQWKTSDWIIQEIGMAVGRSMSLVILLENGCRRPGGLQGDLEFISFDRQSPEKAFGRILEMLQALNPSIGSRVESSPDNEAEAESLSPAEPETASDVDDDTPNSDWTIKEYENAFVWKLVKREPEKADAIYKAFHESDLAASSEVKAEWDAKCEEWRLIFSSKGSLSTLRGLHEAFPKNLRIKTAYASGLSFYSKHVESAELYEVASSLETSASQQLGNMTRAALERAKAGQREQALSLLNDGKTIAMDDVDLGYQLAYGISNCAEELKEEDLRIQAMERMVWLRPDDDDTRFSLAYAHSEANNDDMALHHYLAVPRARRKNHIWNNLGVVYQNFSAPARAIEAFEKSAEEGNTLAMSNLAYRYLNVGFLKEAREQLNKALKEEDPHKNVNQAYATLVQTPDDETKVVDDILESTATKIEAFRKISQAICDPDIAAMTTEWTSPDCDLAVTVEGRSFEGHGRYEVKANALSGLLGNTKATEYELILRGEILGRRVFGDVTRRPVGSTSGSLLRDAEQKKSFAIIFDKDIRNGEVIESINTRFPRYYQISVKAQAAEF